MSSNGTGAITKLTEKGFGFIDWKEGPMPRDGERKKDLFFHANALQGVRFEELREGDAMQFDIENGPKGPQAVNVSRA